MLNRSETIQVSTSYKSNILLAACIGILLLSLYGTLQANWYSQSFWSDNEIRDHFNIVAIALFFFYALLFFSGITFFAILSIPFFCYVGIVGIGPVAAVLWMWACAIAIGSYVAKLVGVDINTKSCLRFAAIGFAMIGIIISILAHFKCNFPSVYCFLFSALGIFAALQIIAKRQLRLPSFRLLSPQKRSIPEILLASLTMLGLTLILIVTTLPDFGHDALSMHLNIPARMLENAKWNFDVTQYVWAVMPFGGDWLYIPPYFFAGEQGVKLLNSSFILATGLACYKLLVPKIRPSFAYAVPALLFTLPLTYLEIGSTFIEAPLTFFFLFCLIEVLSPYQNKRGSWILFGIIAGYTCSIKLTGVLIIPFIFMGALSRSHQRQFEAISFSRLFSAILVFSIFSLPTYLVAFLKTGNPVFPFFNSFFQSPFFPITGDFTNALFKIDLTFASYWNMSIHSKSFGEFETDGAIGVTMVFLPILSILAAMFYRRWWTMAALCAIFAYIFAVFHNQAYLRYAFPIFPWILLSGIWALSTISFASFFATLSIFVLCAIHIFCFPTSTWILQHVDLFSMWKPSAQIEMKRQLKPELIAADIVNKMSVGEPKRILVLGLDPIYSQLPGDAIADSWHSWSYLSVANKDKDLISSIQRTESDIIIHTIKRGYPRESEIMEITNELFRINDVRVGLIKPELIFTKERLQGTDLGSDQGLHWQSSGAVFSADGVEVNIEHPIIQQVILDFSKQDIEPVRRARFIQPTPIEKKISHKVLLSMRASCPIGQLFRSQINWSDTKNAFISTDIQIHECSPLGVDIQRTLTIPENAANAMVYGTSYDARVVKIHRISLRTTP